MDSKQVVDALSTFQVSSPGTPDELAALTMLSANQSFPFFARLLADLGTPPLQPVNADSLSASAAAAASCAALGALFNHHGSDKANSHNYHLLYGSILQNPDAVTAVFEIGLGTNNTDTPSNMGVHGRPGASLRAFRDYLPNAQIYGADVDRRVLFTEERIQTYFIDQTDLASVDALSREIDVDFDLIIDDGLHAPGANMAALVFGVKKLKVGGYFVVEDISPPHEPVWQVVAAMFAEKYACTLIYAHYGILFAMRRKT